MNFYLMFMNILIFRVIISSSLLAMIFLAVTSFLLKKEPILKMINLGFIYVLSIIFMMYLIIIKKAEDILFPIFIIIFINFLLNFLTGISILGGLLKNNDKDDEYGEDDFMDFFKKVKGKK